MPHNELKELAFLPDMRTGTRSLLCAGAQIGVTTSEPTTTVAARDTEA
ncbi:hypothetical protein [Streptomyces sp. NPDC048106]